MTHQTGHPAIGRCYVALIPMLIGLLALVIIASVAVGAVMLPLCRVVRVLLQPSTPGVEATDAIIVWEIRLGRVLLAALMGSWPGGVGCGVAGAISESFS